MNKDSILGIVRHVLTFAGGFVSAEGYATSDEVTAGVAAVVTLVGLVWSVIKNKNARA